MLLFRLYTISPLILLLTGCFSTISIYNGTAIVIIKKQNEIVAAADSKRVYFNDPSLHLLACKINKVGNIYFATSGSVREDFTGFDAAELVREALQVDGTVGEKVAGLDKFMVTPMGKMLLLASTKAPDSFQAMLKRGFVVDVSIFGFENNNSFSYVVAYKLERTGDQGVELVKDVRRCLGDCESIIYDGITTAMLEYNRNAPSLSKIPPIELARKLIEVQIQATPNLVGPPIDIIHIEKTGEKWIQRKPECVDRN